MKKNVPVAHVPARPFPAPPSLPAPYSPLDDALPPASAASANADVRAQSFEWSWPPPVPAQFVPLVAGLAVASRPAHGDLGTLAVCG